MRDSHRRALIIGGIIAAALGVRLALALLPGYVDDQRSWALLGRVALKQGIPNLYATTQFHPLWGIYPPLYHYALALVGLVYTRFFSPNFAIPSYTLNFLLKLVPALGDLAIAAAAFLGLRRDHGDRQSQIAAAAILFSPGVIFASAYWGMFGDSLFTLAVLVSVLAILHGRVTLAWCAIAAGVFFKPQAAVFLPLIIVAGLRSAPTRKLIVAGLAAFATVLLIWSPFILAGTLHDAVDALTRTVGLFPYISANAHNAWWLATGGDGWASDADPLIGPLTARSLGLIAFAALYLATLIWALRAPVKDRLVNAAAFIGFAFFMVTTEMHENYLFPSVCLLAMLIIQPGPTRWIALALNVTWLANMLLTDPLLTNTWLITWPIAELSLAVSAANVIILITWPILLLRSSDSTPTPEFV